MPYMVNGQPIPEDLVREEERRLGRDPRWTPIPDQATNAAHLRAAAEYSVIARTLVEQAAASDPRPVDPDLIEREVRRAKTEGNCRSAFDDSAVRQWVERQFRLQRTHAEMVAGAAKPTQEGVQAFYDANRENFRNPEMFRAAHVVKHVNGEQAEAQEREGKGSGLTEQETHAPFTEVAEKHSACKGNGGDLGQFPAGEMVQEFEDAIRALEPGQRTGIFTTPFGFHIAELRARTPAGPASFEEVRAGIERVLTVQNRHVFFLRRVAEFRDTADIRWEPATAAAGA